jgi:hypothetical protein
MQHTFSTYGIKALFSYPFRKPNWATHLVVLGAFIAGGFIVPVIPWLFAYGYMAELVRRVVREGSDPDLPEWKDWGKLLLDGLRVFGVSLFYIVPVSFVFFIGFGTYMGSMLSMPFFSDSGREGPAILLTLTSMGFFFCAMAVSFLISIVVGILYPAALTHVMVKESFPALFQLRDWWKIFRANLGGFLVIQVLLFGIIFVTQYGLYILVYSFVLCGLAPVLGFILMPYLMTVVSVMMGQAYREGVETLTPAGESTI